jgi:hypothetical protein
MFSLVAYSFYLVSYISFFFSVYAKLSMHVGGCVGDSWSHQSMPTTYFSHIRFEIEINLK